MVAIGEAVGACAKEVIESAREQIQTMMNLFTVGFHRRMCSTLYLDSTNLSQPRRLKVRPVCLAWIADAHRDDGKCFVVRADEKLTAFLELESAVHEIKHDEIRSGQHLHWRNRFA